jgi:hypothetical protein
VAKWWADDVLACRWVDKEMEFNVRQSFGDSLWEPLLAREHLSHENLAYHSGKKSSVRSVGDPSMRLAVVDVTVFFGSPSHDAIVVRLFICESTWRCNL